MSIVRQNSGAQTPAAFSGWPAAEGTAAGGGTGSGTQPSAPANILCSLPRKWLSGKGLPANKMDLNQWAVIKDWAALSAAVIWAHAFLLGI